MANRYQPWFAIVKSEDEAVAMVEAENSTGNYYKRTHHKAHYTSWSSYDGKETGFIVWTVR